MRNEGAFFFQGGSLLLPQPPDAAESLKVPLALSKDLPVIDTFTVPGFSPDDVISAVVVPVKAPLPPLWQAIPVRELLAHSPGPTAPLLRAFHLAQWRQESVFCGSCGSKNTGADGLSERRCPACGRVEFPRIAPAVITLITNDKGQALLAHNKKFSPGVYSLIAGFVEAGESLEEAAAREIREEVGIEVRDILYTASQPWPFPNSLMVGFSARYASGDIKPDGIEIEDARWFSRDTLPALPGPGSVARHLIEKWIHSV